MAQSAEAMLEAGKRLIVLKENEPHGEFVNIVETGLGIHERAAQRMMKAALKFLSPQLQSKATALSVLGKTKLLELISEDDDDLSSLAEGGTVAGLALEDIDRMTSRELRAALREAREDSNAKDERLADRNLDLEKVTQELIKTRKRIQFADPDEVIKDLRVEVIALKDELELTVLGKLREGFNKMAEHGAEHGQDHRFYQADLIRHLELALATLRSDFHLPEHRENEAPVWMAKDEA